MPPWVPNAISSLRLVLVPVWLLCAEAIRSRILVGEPATGYPLVALLLFLGLSDVVDGWIARRYHLTSRVGATLDAVADKSAQFAFITYFTFRGDPAFVQIPIWFWAVIFGRDLALLIGYLTLKWSFGRVDTEHRIHGKVSSVILFFLVLSVAAHVDPRAVMLLLVASALAIVVSTVAYVGDGVRTLRRGKGAA